MVFFVNYDIENSPDLEYTGYGKAKGLPDIGEVSFFSIEQDNAGLQGVCAGGGTVRMYAGQKVRIRCARIRDTRMLYETMPKSKDKGG